MKIAKLLIPALLGLGLFGCGEPEITGKYSNPELGKLTIEKSIKEDKVFILSAAIKVPAFTGDPSIKREKLTTGMWVTYRKDNSLYDVSDDKLLGSLEGDQFILSFNGKAYKRKVD